MAQKGNTFPDDEPETVRQLPYEQNPTTYTRLWSEISTGAVYLIGRPGEMALPWVPITVISMYDTGELLFFPERSLRPQITLAFVPTSQRSEHARSVPPPGHSMRVGPLTGFSSVEEDQQHARLDSSPDLPRAHEHLCLQLDPAKIIHNPELQCSEIHRTYWIATEVPVEDEEDPLLLKLTFPNECRLRPLLLEQRRM